MEMIMGINAAFLLRGSTVSLPGKGGLVMRSVFFTSHILSIQC